MSSNQALAKTLPSAEADFASPCLRLHDLCKSFFWDDFTAAGTSKWIKPATNARSTGRLEATCGFFDDLPPSAPHHAVRHRRDLAGRHPASLVQSTEIDEALLAGSTDEKGRRPSATSASKNIPQKDPLTPGDRR